MENEDNNKPNKSSTLLVILIVVLLISNGVTAYFYFQRSAVSNSSKDQSLTKSITTNIKEESKETTEEGAQVEPTNQVTELTEGEITVAWNDTPIITASDQFFNLQEMSDISDDIDINYNYQMTYDEFISPDIYNIGTIEQGPFTGNDLFIVSYFPPGPSFYSTVYRVIKTEEQLIYLAKHSDEYLGPYKEIFWKNNYLSIANLEPPDNIDIPGTTFSLIKDTADPHTMLTDYNNLKKLFKYNGVDYLYKNNENNCFVASANDGSVREYYLELDFAAEGGVESYQSGLMPLILDIEWLDGSKNTHEYILKELGGCGAAGCINYVDYIQDEYQLTQVGKTSSGDPIYELKDINLKANSSDEKRILEAMYDFYYPGYDSVNLQQLEKIPYGEFLADHPLVFWEDPFGDYIGFKKANYIPAVECGKPVIYLYPEEVTDVSVKVEPTGGFTVTEPLYNGGWLVKAEPDSNLYNYQDGKEYPYLFWEGHGLNYQRPGKGFVVAKNEVKKFLQEKLAQLGLVEVEIGDFMEYWLPRMQQSNYYFITFVSQTEFDKLAPLTVYPQPDTVIRVFMDYQELSEYLEFEPQNIITPERQGFTVVEWGGALYR